VDVYTALWIHLQERQHCLVVAAAVKQIELARRVEDSERIGARSETKPGKGKATDRALFDRERRVWKAVLRQEEVRKKSRDTVAENHCVAATDFTDGALRDPPLDRLGSRRNQRRPRLAGQ